MNKPTELLTCPFCGNVATGGGFSISCTVCPATVSGMNHRDAVEAWNRRPGLNSRCEHQIERGFPSGRPCSICGDEM